VNLHAGQQVRKRCSGFWIDWNKENNTGIVLTTAHLISSKGCSIEQKGDGVEDEYAPNGKVKYYPQAKVSSFERLGAITLPVQLINWHDFFLLTCILCVQYQFNCLVGSVINELLSQITL
jgi:hypothetical protein